MPQGPNLAKGLRSGVSDPFSIGLYPPQAAPIPNPLTPCPLRAMKRNEALNRFKQKSLAKQGFFGYFILLIFATKNPSCNSSGATHSVPGMETGSRGTLSNAVSSSGTICAPVLRSTRETISSFS